MFSSARKPFDDFDKVTELSTRIGNALQNYTAARTLIRDFVISFDEEYYVQVEQRLSVATDALTQAEPAADRDETRNTIHQIRESIRAWSVIARQVRDAFANYQATVHSNVLENFSKLTQVSNALLPTNAAAVTQLMLDLQTANTAITRYLINGENQHAEDAQRAIGWAKTKLDEVKQGNESLTTEWASFAVQLDAYEEGFQKALASRKNAYHLFHNHLAPLGVRVQANAEQFHHQIVDYQRKNDELKKAYRALEEVSLTDPLTGLWNRRFLNQHLEADVALTVRHYENWLRHPSLPPPVGGDLVFFMVDLDYFKSVNDKYGHAAGDKILVEVRQRLREAFRESDYLVRWGGEEFLVVARGVNRLEAEIMAERICAAVRGHDFDLDDGVRLAKTCSVGFACFPFLPSHPRLLSWSQVVELADQALYMAKHGGRNAWVGISGTERTRPEEVLRRLAQATAEAVRDGELRLTTSLKDTAAVAGASSTS